jgi:hypothetical protein
MTFTASNASRIACLVAKNNRKAGPAMLGLVVIHSRFAVTKEAVAAR